MEREFRVGDWLVRPELNRISTRGAAVHLEPKVMEVLVFLARHAREVLPKERIIQAVWPDTFVTDDVLTHAISELRKAFDDDPKQPRVIETISRRGYRLIAPVQGLAAEPARPDTLPQVQRKWRNTLSGSVAVALLIPLGGYYLWNQSGRREAVELRNPTVLTTAQGVEDYPNWRPDGSQIAYQSNQTGNWDIWVRGVNGGGAVNLTADHKGADLWPSWSPDGTRIAFWSNRDGGGYYIMPALGGSTRKVITPSFRRPGPPQWSPSGTDLAYAVSTDQWGPPGHSTTGTEADSAGLQSSNFVEIVSLHRGTSRRMFLPPKIWASGMDLSWSADGKFFAYATAVDYASTISQVCVLRVGDGQVFELTDGKTLDWAPFWSSDSRAIYYISNRGGTMDVWKQSLAENGTPLDFPEQVTNGLEIRHAAFSRDGERLAYSRGRNMANLWRFPILSNRAATWADAQQLTFDQSGLSNLRLSPDGKRLAFTLFRHGQRHIWLLPVEGGELRRLTTDPMHQIRPSWSPDGKQIVFHVPGGGDNRYLWIAPVEGGKLVQLTRDNAATNPQWSPDGSRIAFNSKRTGNWDIWVISLETGEEKQMTRNPGNDSACCEDVWSPDGKQIVFRRGANEVWAVSVEDGTERRIVRHSGPVFYRRWSRDGKSILFDSNPTRLWKVDSSGGKPQALTEGSHRGFWSRDGSEIYFFLSREGVRNLYEIPDEGGSERPLTDLKGRYGAPGMCRTDGQNLYLTWQEAMGDLWVMDVH